MKAFHHETRRYEEHRGIGEVCWLQSRVTAERLVELRSTNRTAGGGCPHMDRGAARSEIVYLVRIGRDFHIFVATWVEAYMVV